MTLFLLVVAAILIVFSVAIASRRGGNSTTDKTEPKFSVKAYEPMFVHDITAWENVSIPIRVIWRSIDSPGSSVTIQVFLEADKSIEPFFGGSVTVNEWIDIASVRMAADGYYDTDTPYGEGLVERNNDIIALSRVVVDRFLVDQYAGDGVEEDCLLSLGLRVQEYSSYYHANPTEGWWSLIAYDPEDSPLPDDLVPIEYNADRVGEVRVAYLENGPPHCKVVRLGYMRFGGLKEKEVKLSHE